MPQARFIADPDPCIVFDRTFQSREWTDVSDLDDWCIERLAGNPTFEFQADAPAKKGKAAPAEPGV